MGSLLDSIKNSISPDMIRNIASQAGESPDGIRKGIETAGATMLGSLASKAGDSGFLSQIMSLVSSYGNQALGAAAGAGGSAPAAASEAGSSLISSLFGANKSAIEGKIAQVAGLSPSAGSTILASAAPLVLSTLGSKLAGGPAGLASALTSELPSLKGLIPAGLPGLHLPNLGGMAGEAASAVRGAVPEKAGGGWLWPVLLLAALAVAVGVWWWSKKGADATTSAPVETSATPVPAAAPPVTLPAIDDATKAAWAKLGEIVKRSLPGGVEINVPKNGVENKLVDWIQSSNPVDKTTWFDFDRLLFDTGKATLQPASQDQLNNVAAIMKAFPKVKVKLGGYTDNQGDPAMNLKLSEERAKNVMGELTKLGVDASRMEAQGYGQEHPVGDNATAEGRALNRRISLRVTEK